MEIFIRDIFQFSCELESNVTGMYLERSWALAKL